MSGSVATNEQVADSLARSLGLTAHQVRRQRRWRPTWFVDGERDGKPVSVVVRGERVDTQVFPLRHEVAFHRILADHGIPVPAVHAWLDDVNAVALEHVPGRPDFDGVSLEDRDRVVDEYLQVLARVHALPVEPFAAAGILQPATPEDAAMVGHRHVEDRDRVVDEYLQVLARVHALPVEPFAAAGILHPTTPEDAAMVGHRHVEGLWRAKKRHPHPFLEFCLGWLHRHPPQPSGPPKPIVWDTGQFHHEDGHLVAILDMEFGSVGDPMVDLTVWRMRDTLIPFGDFNRLYARYEELTGVPVDVDAVKRHHFAATLGNEQMFGPTVLEPVADTDLMNNMQWNSETNLHATEALAEFMDVELPGVEPPEPRVTRQDNTHEHLVRSLRALSLSEGDEFRQHELRLAFRAARHLQRVHQIGDAVAQADLDDLVPLLGHRPGTWQEGDAELERFVLADAATGRYDEELLRLFHRRNLRVHMQLGPPGSKMVAHHPTRRFDETEPLHAPD